MAPTGLVFDTATRVMSSGLTASRDRGLRDTVPNPTEIVLN